MTEKTHTQLEWYEMELSETQTEEFPYLIPNCSYCCHRGENFTPTYNSDKEYKIKFRCSEWRIDLNYAYDHYIMCEKFSPGLNKQNYLYGKEIPPFSKSYHYQEVPAHCEFCEYRELNPTQYPSPIGGTHGCNALHKYVKLTDPVCKEWKPYYPYRIALPEVNHILATLKGKGIKTGDNANESIAFTFMIDDLDKKDLTARLFSKKIPTKKNEKDREKKYPFPKSFEELLCRWSDINTIYDSSKENITPFFFQGYFSQKYTLTEALCSLINWLPLKRIQFRVYKSNFQKFDTSDCLLDTIFKGTNNIFTESDTHIHLFDLYPSHLLSEQERRDFNEKTFNSLGEYYSYAIKTVIVNPSALTAILDNDSEKLAEKWEKFPKISDQNEGKSVGVNLLLKIKDEWDVKAKNADFGINIKSYSETIKQFCNNKYFQLYFMQNKFDPKPPEFKELDGVDLKKLSKLEKEEYKSAREDYVNWYKDRYHLVWSLLNQSGITYSSKDKCPNLIQLLEQKLSDEAHFIKVRYIINGLKVFSYLIDPINVKDPSGQKIKGSKARMNYSGTFLDMIFIILDIIFSISKEDTIPLINDDKNNREKIMTAILVEIAKNKTKYQIIIDSLRKEIQVYLAHSQLSPLTTEIFIKECAPNFFKLIRNIGQELKYLKPYLISPTEILSYSENKIKFTSLKEITTTIDLFRLYLESNHLLRPIYSETSTEYRYNLGTIFDYLINITPNLKGISKIEEESLNNKLSFFINRHYFVFPQCDLWFEPSNPLEATIQKELYDDIKSENKYLRGGGKVQMGTKGQLIPYIPGELWKEMINQYIHSRSGLDIIIMQKEIQQFIYATERLKNRRYSNHIVSIEKAGVVIIKKFSMNFIKYLKEKLKEDIPINQILFSIQSLYSSTYIEIFGKKPRNNNIESSVYYNSRTFIRQNETIAVNKFTALKAIQQLIISQFNTSPKNRDMYFFDCIDFLFDGKVSGRFFYKIQSLWGEEPPQFKYLNRLILNLRNMADSPETTFKAKDFFTEKQFRGVGKKINRKLFRRRNSLLKGLLSTLDKDVQRVIHRFWSAHILPAILIKDVFDNYKVDSLLKLNFFGECLEASNEREIKIKISKNHFVSINKLKEISNKIEELRNQPFDPSKLQFYNPENVFYFKPADDSKFLDDILDYIAEQIKKLKVEITKKDEILESLGATALNEEDLSWEQKLYTNLLNLYSRICFLISHPDSVKLLLNCPIFPSNIYFNYVNSVIKSLLFSRLSSPSIIASSNESSKSPNIKTIVSNIDTEGENERIIEDIFVANRKNFFDAHIKHLDIVKIDEMRGAITKKSNFTDAIRFILGWRYIHANPKWIIADLPIYPALFANTKQIPLWIGREDTFIDQTATEKVRTMTTQLIKNPNSDLVIILPFNEEKLPDISQILKPPSIRQPPNPINNPISITDPSLKTNIFIEQDKENSLIISRINSLYREQIEQTNLLKSFLGKYMNFIVNKDNISNDDVKFIQDMNKELPVTEKPLIKLKANYETTLSYIFKDFHNIPMEMFNNVNLNFNHPSLTKPSFFQNIIEIKNLLPTIQAKFKIGDDDFKKCTWKELYSQLNDQRNETDLFTLLTNSIVMNSGYDELKVERKKEINTLPLATLAKTLKMNLNMQAFYHRREMRSQLISIRSANKITRGDVKSNRNSFYSKYKIIWENSGLLDYLGLSGKNYPQISKIQKIRHDKWKIYFSSNYISDKTDINELKIKNDDLEETTTLKKPCNGLILTLDLPVRGRARIRKLFTEDIQFGPASIESIQILAPTYPARKCQFNLLISIPVNDLEGRICQPDAHRFRDLLKSEEKTLFFNNIRDTDVIGIDLNRILCREIITTESPDFEILLDGKIKIKENGKFAQLSGSAIPQIISSLKLQAICFDVYPSEKNKIGFDKFIENLISTVTMQDEYLSHIDHSQPRSSKIFDEYYKDHVNKLRKTSKENVPLKLSRATYDFIIGKKEILYSLKQKSELSFSELMNLAHYRTAVKMSHLNEHIGLNAQRIRKLDPNRTLIYKKFSEINSSEREIYYRIKRIKNDNYYLSKRHDSLRNALIQSLYRMILAICYLGRFKRVAHENLNFNGQTKSEKGVAFNRMLNAMFDDSKSFAINISKMYKRFGLYSENINISIRGVSPAYTSAKDTFALQECGVIRDIMEGELKEFDAAIKNLCTMDRRIDYDWGASLYFPGKIIHFHTKAGENIGIRGYVQFQKDL